jgi:hypothetical protein
MEAIGKTGLSFRRKRRGESGDGVRGVVIDALDAAA